jgi:hypothetical protein
MRPIHTLRHSGGQWLSIGLCLLFVWAPSAMAQPRKAELSGHIGYQMGGLVDETTKDNGVDSLAQALGIHSAAVFGLIFNYHLTRTLHLELVWDQQPTQIDLIDRATGTTTELTDLRVHYYHAGLVYNWSNSTKQPFLGMTVGMTRYQARGDFDSESGFSFAPVFGYKTWMSDHFGLRLHTRVILTNVQAGELFSNPVTGFSHTHTKNTWSTQIQIGVAMTVGM